MNKKTEEQSFSHPTREVERDTMPRQVATEMLSDPRVRMTNRMRKTFRDARARHFVSTREKTPILSKLAAKLKLRSFQALTKWLARANVRRAAGQRAYLRAGEDTTLAAPVREALLALLEVKVAEIDLLIDGLETEILSRVTACKKVQAVRTGKGNAVKFQKV